MDRKFGQIRLTSCSLHRVGEVSSSCLFFSYSYNIPKYLSTRVCNTVIILFFLYHPRSRSQLILLHMYFLIQVLIVTGLVIAYRCHTMGSHLNLSSEKLDRNRRFWTHSIDVLRVRIFLLSYSFIKYVLIFCAI